MKEGGIIWQQNISYNKMVLLESISNRILKKIVMKKSLVVNRLFI